MPQESVLIKFAELDALLGAYPSIFSGPATTHSSWHEPAAWLESASTPAEGSASRYTALPQHAEAAVALALSEIRTAREILRVRAVARDAAFHRYLETLGFALDAYDSEKAEASDKVTRLAISLVTARTNLQDDIQSLAGWLAISRAAGSSKIEPRLPQRFISEPSPLSHDESSDADVETWNDLQLVRGD